MKTAAELRKQRDDAIAERTDVGSELATAIADGRDAKALQRRRDALDDKIRDLEPAIGVAEGREQEAAELEAERQAERLRAKARQSSEKLFAAADNVDAAIARLGEAYSKYRLALIDAKRNHMRADSDVGAVERSVTHGLRWALARGARQLLEDSGAARVPRNREEAFGATVRRTAPKL